MNLVWNTLQFNVPNVNGRAVSRRVVVHNQLTDTDFELLPGDRLEIGGNIADVYSHAAELPDPCELTFWRRHPETPYTAMPSIMSVPGFKYEFFMLDTMHMLDLGVCARLVGQALKRILLEGSTFGNKATLSGQASGVASLNAKLREYYHQTSFP